jgi:uncharacterized protein (DUF58 family)
MATNGRVAAGGAAVMFLMAIQTQSVWMQVVGCGLVGLLAISYCSVIRRRTSSTWRIEGPGRTVVGASFQLAVTVRNVGKRATLPMRLRTAPLDNPSLLPAVSVYIDPIAAGDQVVADITRTPQLRGATRRWSLSSDEIGPFGFFIASEKSVHSMDLLVAPRPCSALALQRVTGERVDDSGPMGPGLEVRGVREWRPGDAARHVHWRSTARTGRLTVLEYGEPTIGSVGVLVAGLAGEPQFERAVATAASTARQAVDDGVPVFLAVDDAGPTRIEQVTARSWHRLFAGVGTVVVGPPASVDLLLDTIGKGGVLLLATGPGVASGWRPYVEAAAVQAHVRIVDVAEHGGDR